MHKEEQASAEERLQLQAEELVAVKEYVRNLAAELASKPSGQPQDVSLCQKNVFGAQFHTSTSHQIHRFLVDSNIEPGYTWYSLLLSVIMVFRL